MTKLKPSKGSSLAFIMQTRSSTGPFRERGGGEREPWPATTASIQPENIRRKRRIEKNGNNKRAGAITYPKVFEQ